MPMNMPTLRLMTAIGLMLSLLTAGPSSARGLTGEPPIPPGYRLYIATKGVLYSFETGPAIVLPYTLELDKQTLQVFIPPGLPKHQVDRLLRFVMYGYSLLPGPSRAAIRAVVFEPGQLRKTKQQAEVIRQLNLQSGKKFYSPAFSSTGRILFTTVFQPEIDGGYDLDLKAFFHEAGHCVAFKLFGSVDPSGGWAEAVARDGNFVRDYSQTSYQVSGRLAEDFADSYAYYMIGRSQPLESSFYRKDGDHPTNIGDFSYKHPRRAYLLASLLKEHAVPPLPQTHAQESAEFKFELSSPRSPAPKKPIPKSSSKGSTVRTKDVPDQPTGIYF